MSGREAAGRTVAGALKEMAAGELTALDLAEETIARVRAHDGTIQAYVTMDEEALRIAAGTADAARESGTTGPLLGIPVALKDIYDVAGLPTRCGSVHTEDARPAAEDSRVWSHLRSAGAVLSGKVVTHEYAFGVISAPTRNPWDPTRVPGGSSGGSGAAVAAGFAPAAMGTDTGGSIRIPAALCGISGLKPTFGRVSRRGVFPLSWTLDHTGPMAWSAEDCALLLREVAGHDPLEHDSADVPVQDPMSSLDEGVEGMTIAVPENYFFDDLGAGVGDAVEAALQELVAAGAVLKSVTIPEVGLVPGVMDAICGPEGALVHRERLADDAPAFEPATREDIERGMAVWAVAYVEAERKRRQVQAAFEAVLDSADVLMTPTVPVVAPAADTDPHTALPMLNRLTAPFNVARLPALAVPAGFVDGLPVSLQIAGRPFDEATVLRAGHAFQQRTDWHTRRPLLH